MTQYRPGIEPIPHRMKGRPVARGYPVPWFVAQLEDGTYEFRGTESSKILHAIRYKVCWLCGQPLGGNLAFVVGPMCTITRTTSEPPSHRDCAEWAMRVCPFLANRVDGYRKSNLPEHHRPAAGEPIERGPSAACLWMTKRYEPFSVHNGVLIKMGDPFSVDWYREARRATRAEVMEAIDSGYPILLNMATEDGPDAIKELEAMRDRALRYVPD